MAPACGCSIATCPRCRGLGWTRKPGHVDGRDWPIICSVCLGVGELKTWASLARALDVQRKALRRVAQLRAGTDASARVLTAIAERFPDAMQGG